MTVLRWSSASEQGYSEVSGFWAWAESVARGQWGQSREREISFPTAWWRLFSLLPDGSRLKRLWDGAGGVTCNSGGLAGEAGVGNVQQGGKRDPSDLLSCCRSADLHLPTCTVNLRWAASVFSCADASFVWWTLFMETPSGSCPACTSTTWTV